MESIPGEDVCSLHQAQLRNGGSSLSAAAVDLAVPVDGWDATIAGGLMDDQETEDTQLMEVEQRGGTELTPVDARDVASHALAFGPQQVLGAPDGMAVGATVGSMYEQISRQYIECELLLHHDNIAVTEVKEAKYEASSAAWGILRRDIDMLGFRMEEEDSWNVLGLYKMEGPEPDTLTINRRAAVLKDLLETISDAALEPAEQEARAEWVCKIRAVRERCLQEVTEVKRLRRAAKVAKDRQPRWYEIDAATTEWLLRQTDDNTTCAINLSNVLRSREARVTQRVLDPQDARHVTSRIIRGGQEALDTLKELDVGGLVMWCPDSREDIGKVCMAIAKVAEASLDKRIHLLIPLEPRPGCHSVTQFTDTWSHDLLQGKWTPFIEQTRFSSEPVKVVVSGLHAPMHQIKSICMITLGTRGGSGLKAMLAPRGSIGTAEDCEIIVIDIAEDDELEFVKRAGSLSDNLVQRWDGPTRASSTQNGHKRLCYMGKIKQAGAWAARLTIMQVKAALGDMKAIVGLNSTYGNNEAILVDVSGPGAAHKVQNLTEDSVMVSSRLMIVRSSASELQWRQKVEEVFQEQDEAFIEKVRYRPSQGGTTIAVPPVLKEEEGRRRYEKKGSDGKEKQVVVRFGGEFVKARADEAENFMRMLQDTAQIQFLSQESEAVSSEYQWRKIQDARFGWKGDVVLQCNTKEEVLRLFAAAEGKTIEVPGGGRISIEIIPHVSLAEESRNARRG